MTKKRFLLAAISGVVITLLTGLLNVTPQGLVGATWYGWPLAWLYVIVYPGSPMNIGWMNIVGDLVFWVIVSLIIILLVTRITKSKQ